MIPESCFELLDHPGNDLTMIPMLQLNNSPIACQNECKSHSQCQLFTAMHNGSCFLKTLSGVASSVGNTLVISGPKDCPSTNLKILNILQAFIFFNKFMEAGQTLELGLLALT